ncbi:tetratricopeptide repeat protein [Streptomyces canus]|uniref:tetratricopeptide repeat protein n=1 Tax=Streptomyces canus TaxID=58343 RepID=UPI00277EFC26|nr:tetratricopeptide repeat protein [Streptomyces canus]MDQ0765574.1 tetratricopeptide (TPR) repeat protein [Streptomyces canus]
MRSSPPLGASTYNTITNGTFYGPTVQAGTIHGGVHVHEAVLDPLIPRQLFPVPAAFTDREDDLDVLTSQIGEVPDYAVRIVVINGPGGVGKTSLGNRLLHVLAAEYTGGQLYADLLGYAAEGPASTSEILSRFLRSLHPGAQPTSAEELAAWWRSATARPGQRVSILLDNARRAAQVQSLLPGGSGHLIVVTSRSTLAELAPDGALLHRLGPFDHDAAQQYLTRCLGDQRVAREPDAAAQITRLAAGSPMAIALTVTHLAANPDQPLAELASGAASSAPADSPHPSLTHQEAAVTHALDRSYWSLPRSTPAPAVYRRMGSLFALDFDVPLTAAVCNLSRSEAEAALDQLHELKLIELRGEVSSRGQVYRFHDITRDHARARATMEATFGEPEEVLQRALDFYLATASMAERILTPTHRPLRRDYVYPPAEPIEFPDDATALAWLYAQRDNMLHALRAAAAGLDRPTWQLTHAIWPLLRSSHDYELWSESHELGLQAARRCQDREAEVEMLNTWGVGLRGAGKFEEAAQTFTAVLQIAREEQDHRAESQALHELGAVNLHGGDPAEAEAFLLQARQQRTKLARTSESEPDRLTYTRAVAITNICLGQAQLELGRATKAIETLTAARSTLLEVEDWFDAARALAWLARAYAAGGDPGKGEEYGRLAVAECDASGSARWRAHSRELLGHTLRDSRRPDLARSLYGEAITICSAVSRRDESRVRQALQDIS